MRASSQAGGFSPALASRLTLEDGTGVFVKAIAPDDVSGAPGGQELYRREARIAGALPKAVPAPRLLASMESGGWEILIFEEIVGLPPALPWRPQELSRVLAAMAALASFLTPSPIPAPPATVPGGVNGWALLCADPGALGRTPWTGWLGTDESRTAFRYHLHIEPCPPGDNAAAHRHPCRQHPPDRRGGRLVDRPHARVGAPWVDLVYFLPSVAMQGGGDPQTIFWDHPVADRAELRAVCGVLAGLAGFFIYGATREPPPGLPTLRKFQLAQGIEALAWLRQMMD